MTEGRPEEAMEYLCPKCQGTLAYKETRDFEVERAIDPYNGNLSQVYSPINVSSDTSLVENWLECYDCGARFEVGFAVLPGSVGQPEHVVKKANWGKR